MALVARLTRSADGRHQVHCPTGAVFELSEDELKNYARRNFGMVDSGLSAKVQFDILARQYADDHSVSREVAMLRVAETRSGRELWEQIRLDELASSKRR